MKTKPRKNVATGLLKRGEQRATDTGMEKDALGGMAKELGKKRIL